MGGDQHPPAREWTAGANAQPPDKIYKQHSERQGHLVVGQDFLFSYGTEFALVSTLKTMPQLRETAHTVNTFGDRAETYLYSDWP